MTDTDLLRGVLDAWKDAIDRHRPQRVADLFTTDAVFQGLHPYSVGRAGVAEYYGSQPLGMTVDYRILESRRLADDVVLGWVSADFTLPDGRPKVAVMLTVVARRIGDAWLIGHYHVSPGISA
jgi:uncharacterized protein (TIGR02246 family)